MKDIQVWILEYFLSAYIKKREEVSSELSDIDDTIFKLKKIIDDLG